MSDVSARDRAAQQADQLVAHLQTLPSTTATSELIELGGHLARAIRAFHMEAIRFRAFTMRRLIKQHADVMPPEVMALMAEVTAALEAAGFHTKSVST